MSITNESNIEFLSVDRPANIRWSMGKGVPGSIDGLILQPGGNSSWRKQPNNVPLRKNTMWMPSGTPLPLANERMIQAIPRSSMTMFTSNVSSPSCCPSTYSTYGGCICTTKDQSVYVGENRGNNKNYYSDSFYTLGNLKHRFPSKLN